MDTTTVPPATTIAAPEVPSARATEATVSIPASTCSRWRATGTQLDAPTPCTNWTVTQVLQHAAGDQLAWAAAVGPRPPLAPLIAPGAARAGLGRNPAGVC